MISREPASDLATIIRWVEGRLDPSTSAVVAEAAAQDPRVRAIVLWMRGFHRAAAALPLVDPASIAVRPPSPSIVRVRPVLRERSGDAVEVVARMLFDSRQDVASANLTSVEAEAHFAFTCDVADVVLDVRRLSPGRVRIEGQVLPADGSSRAFAVAATGPRMTPVHAATGDAQGGFRLSALPDRVAKLRLESGGMAIVVQVDVGWS